MLFNKKLKVAAEASNVFRIPDPIHTMLAFNSFFPSRPCKGFSVRGKRNNIPSQIRAIRNDTRRILRSRKGVDRISNQLYIPVITAKELRQYCADGTVVVDDLGHTCKNVTLGDDAIPKRKGLMKRIFESDDCEENGPRRLKRRRTEGSAA